MENEDRTGTSTLSIRRPPIAPSVAKKLGYYVYLYRNPMDDSVFYVGKGKNLRALDHLQADEEEKKEISKIIQEIRSGGREPQIEMLAHDLRNAEAAHRVEAAAIDLLGLENLANVVRGHGVKFGRMPLDEAVAHYAQRKANIREPSILICINKLYRYGMTKAELYDVTRSAWIVGTKKREQAQLAFSVFESVIREVYRLERWLPAGSTFNTRYNGRGIKNPARWEFVGTIAEDGVRDHYINRYVGHLFPPGARNPISYVNVA